MSVTTRRRAPACSLSLCSVFALHSFFLLTQIFEEIQQCFCYWSMEPIDRPPAALERTAGTANWVTLTSNIPEYNSTRSEGEL